MEVTKKIPRITTTLKNSVFTDRRTSVSDTPQHKEQTKTNHSLSHRLQNDTTD